MIRRFCSIAYKRTAVRDLKVGDVIRIKDDYNAKRLVGLKNRLRRLNLTPEKKIPYYSRKRDLINTQLSLEHAEHRAQFQGKEIVVTSHVPKFYPDYGISNHFHDHSYFEAEMVDDPSMKIELEAGAYVFGVDNNWFDVLNSDSILQ